MIVNKWIAGEKIEDEDLEEVEKAWRYLFDVSIGVEGMDAKRVAILEELIKYCMERVGADEFDWRIVIAEFMDAIIWRMCNEEEESQVWEYGKDSGEDGQGDGEV